MTVVDVMDMCERMQTVKKMVTTLIVEKQGSKIRTNITDANVTRGNRAERLCG